jgi:hypothetical protein
MNAPASRAASAVGRMYRHHGCDYTNEQLSLWFAWHMQAMTAEDLHSKADIAWELAHRDAIKSDLLAALEACLPFIDDAGDIAQFYPDSAATTKCREAVEAARAALSKARGLQEKQK